jgi:spore maturation protein CgeB
MSSFEEISQKMRTDWNRRVGHDYRFWMSDGEQSDEHMWESGERDFSKLFPHFPDGSGKTVLELGCGVGRILRTALRVFDHVIGIDVSDAALTAARKLLGPSDSLELIVGNGFTLDEVASSSIDYFYSFAAITSCPTQVIASYLVEMARVMKLGGSLRLQVYLGVPQEVRRSDTLHLRCFDEDIFLSAVSILGFAIEWLSPLELPFKVSFEELGIHAKVLALRKVHEVTVDSDKINEILSRGIHEDDSLEGALEGLEHFVALEYAETLRQRGDEERAGRAADYALSLLPEGVRDAGSAVASLPHARSPEVKTDVAITESSFERNTDAALHVCRERPDLLLLGEALLALRKSGYAFSPGLTVHETEEGYAIAKDGIGLDHLTKPRRAAQTWCGRQGGVVMSNDTSEMLIYGFAGGYEVDALVNASPRETSVVEIDIDILALACALRNLSPLLQKVKRFFLSEATLFKDIGVYLSAGTKLLVRPQSHALRPALVARLRECLYGAQAYKSLNPTHAVIGPLQGGTLPITAYVHRALEEEKRRSTLLDFSPFAGAYHAITSFTPNKVATLTHQNGYLELLTKLIVEQCVSKNVDIALFMAQAPVSLSLLSTLREKGIITALWFLEDYLRFPYWRSIGPHYDFVFTIQKDECINEMKKAGISNVTYVPAGCDPEVHRPLQLTLEDRQRWGSPLSFVGAGYHNRQQAFASLSHLPLRIWGTEWPESKPFDRLVQEQGRRLSPEEYVKIFNATDINLNLHSSSERDGVDPTGDFVNPRVFELAACEAFQLVDERSLLPECFTPGEDIVTFSSIPDLKEKITYFLEHPEERRRIARKARETVLARHTYTQRIREILTSIYAQRAEVLRERQIRSPWNGMIRRAEGITDLEQRCRFAFERGEAPTLDALVSDIATGSGDLSPTEQKLLFLYHVRKQMILIPRE